MVEEDLTVNDRVIPKGWMVQTATAVDHYRCDVFEDPNQYDPLRFTRDRAEHRKERHAILSFGGGLHKCAGMNFANAEMAIITALLFRNYDLKIVSEAPRIIRSMGSSQPSKTIIHYTRRQ